MDDKMKPTVERIQISVDDLGVLDPANREPARTLSLNRLSTDMYKNNYQSLFKCPSFPKLSPRRHHNQHRGSPQGSQQSTSNQRAVSLSVQPSNEEATTDERGISEGRGRCTSHEGDRLPPLTAVSPVSHKEHLSPAALVGRSTSCPSIHRTSPIVTNRNYKGNNITDDIDLKDEVINDLPLDIDPGQHFPDFFPRPPFEEKHQEERSDTVFEEKPMHTRRIKPSLDRHSSSHKRSSVKKSSSFVNIGDIPASLAQKVILQQDNLATESMDKIQVKCIEWLNTLD